MANNETTTKFKADISELKSEFQKAQRVIRVANSEFKAATGGMENWNDSADGVEAKLSQLNSVFDAEKKKLQSLQSQYKLTVKHEGAASKGAQELLIKINNQKAAVAKCESQISKYNNKLENLKTKNTETKTASEKLNTVISDQEKDLQELKDKYTDVVLVHGENSDSAKSLKKEINKLSGELHENKTKMQNAREAADKFDETLEKKSGGSSGVNAYKIALGHLMAEGIKKIIGSLKDMVTELSNVDSAYQNFASKTGKNAEEMEKYKEQIKDLYGDNYGDNLNDIADSMATVVQNTKETDPSKIKELTKNALVLRDTFGYDIQETMRAVNMLMDQFGISGIEAFNLIVQGAQNGLDKNGDMLDSINEYSVHYKQMGYSANEFFNSLANGTEAGTFSVDKLGDAMKEFGIRTKDTSKTTQEGFALLGYTADETVEDLQKRFAEGGEAAQSATQEVLNELFKMDDKVAQNQAGVALFGTMWEDLGIDGVKALTETQGSLKTTKKSMEELNKIKYDDMQNSVKALGREFKTEILLPVVEKALPKAKKGVNWLKDNYKKLIPIVKTLGGVMAAAFAINKTTKFIKSVKTLTPLLSALSGPTGKVILAATALAIFAEKTALSTGHIGKLNPKIQEMSKKVNENATKFENAKQKFTDWQTAKDEAVKDTSEEFNYYNNLWTELQGIVDQNGKVKQGYEDRAKWITEKLGGVTDTEIKLTGGVISEYDKLKKKLDEVLLAKQAQATYDANEDAYRDAVANRSEALDNYRTAEQDLGSAEKALKDLEKEYALLDVEYAQLLKKNTDKNGNITHTDQMIKIVRQMADIEELDYPEAQKNVQELRQQVSEYEDLYTNIISTIQNHENLGSAIVSGEQKKINDALLKLKNGFITAENGSKESILRMRNNYKTQLENLKQDVLNKVPGITQAQVNEMQKMVNLSENELKKFAPKSNTQGKQGVKQYADGIKAKSGLVRMASVDISNVAANGLASANTSISADYLMQGFLNRIKKSDIELSDTMYQLAQCAVMGFNNGLGVHSPSRETYKSGGFFVQGFENALTDKIKAIKKHVGSLAMSAIKAFNSKIKGDQFDLSGLTYAANSIVKSGKPNAKQRGAANPNSIVNNITYNQTNQSPKPLNRLDIYRNTKNLLTWKGGIT